MITRTYKYLDVLPAPFCRYQYYYDVAHNGEITSDEVYGCGCSMATTPDLADLSVYCQEDVVEEQS